MSWYIVFIVATVVSFVGSIPPGTINISVMQLAILQRRTAAISFAFGAAFVELFYAGFTVRFHVFLTDSTNITEYFHIIAGTAMLILGFVNLKSTSKATDIKTKHQDIRKRNAFTRGALIGIANPLTVPFWLAVTAALEKQGWVTLDGINLYAYAIGISVGTFILLLGVIQLGVQFKAIANNRLIVHTAPGILFLLMGLYSYYQWYLTF